MRVLRNKTYKLIVNQVVYLSRGTLTVFNVTRSFATQTNRLQLVLNSAARAVTKTPKFHHITPILKYLHLLKINERIKYKVLSLT